MEIYTILLYTCLSLPILLLIRRYFRKTLRPSKDKIVVITGCDSGFGRAAAIKLSQDGYHVFAGCLNATNSDLEALSNNIQTIQLDVTKPAEISNAAETVTEYLKDSKSRRLIGVVSNAGISSGTYLEHTSMETFDRIVNINLFGTVRVFKAFLPILRNYGTSSGRLVAIASLAVEVNYPGLTAYCASKAGMKAMASCLRYEVERFGISVSVVFPDAYYTDVIKNPDRLQSVFEGEIDKAAPEILNAYGGRECLLNRNRRNIKMLREISKKDISPVLESISHAVSNAYPQKTYYPISPLNRVAVLISVFCPSFLEFLVKYFEK